MRRPVITTLLVILAAFSAPAAADEIPVTELDYPAELAVVRRADWGWQPLERGMPEHTIERITIHHGGVDFPDDKDPVEHLRALQSWSRSDKDWIDIPYHFMIDRQGRIYETRPINYPGDTNTEYDPTGHALVEVMGHYEHQLLSEEQLDAMVAIVAFLAAEFDVPIENIAGHKDYADTTCPGEGVYRYLRDGTIRSRVRDSRAVFPTRPLSGSQPVPESPRNVIFMLGDGMGFAQVKAYRMYADDPATELVEPLPMEAYLVGAVSTDSIRLECSSGDCVRDPHGFTDSASSATAYATGHDTVVGRISKTTEGETLPTILEGAKAAGKATGMVATSQITHASPAAFGSHVDSRKNHASIADQYLDSKWHDAPMVDVLLGGGAAKLRRGDRDLVPEFQAAGYTIALDREQLLAAEGPRLLGLFADEGMPRAWNRDATVPSLAEMTGAALAALERDPDGFFLMVEGSQVDWGAHDNSVVDVVSEMEDFVAAVRLALDFAASRGDTLVVVTADHETGGMALGRDGVYRWDARPIRGLEHTPEWMADAFMKDKQPLSAFLGVQIPFGLSKAEAAALDATERDRDTVRDAIVDLFNQHTLTGWSTSGHTGVDVPLYVFGPGRERFGGVMQNEDVGRVLWQLFLPGQAVTSGDDG